MKLPEWMINMPEQTKGIKCTVSNPTSFREDTALITGIDWSHGFICFISDSGERWRYATPYTDELEQKLKPFDKVLVKNSLNAKWEIDIFIEQNDINGCFECFRSAWNICIPYKNNEHLYEYYKPIDKE